ncbi:hypothetical protein LX77_02077 [Gelidibacter algens]|uniref:ParE-like toxin of type II ParDE toxin-antitoxin system n=1 Tax=Gelidibacter algens TaxID=49280 RepID=A0A1A7R5U1_9FLAO|nr:hypothetical protein [Gelidibacter algens]OBX26117.1 hypothetical protein A9996_06200 [Gelidibacter algens]RAJ24523.1 hypothetical protein LX77_02077 [Gelidibacter algens]
MSYKVLISDEAYFDISDAMFWYHTKQVELKTQFLSEIKSSIEPYHIQKRYKSVRILFLKTFPFGIHFTIQDNTVKVIAVFHTSKNPQNWTKQF